MIEASINSGGSRRSGHWSVALLYPTYAEALTRQLKKGEKITTPLPQLTLERNSDGVITDIAITATGIFIVTDRARQIIEPIARADVQFLRASLADAPEEALYVMNVVSCVDCVVDGESNPIVIDSAQVQCQRVFRVPTRPMKVVIAEETQRAIVDSGLLINGFWRCRQRGDEPDAVSEDEGA